MRGHILRLKRHHVPPPAHPTTTPLNQPSPNPTQPNPITHLTHLHPGPLRLDAPCVCTPPVRLGDRAVAGGLDDMVTEELLQAAFVRFGDIVSIQLPKDPASRTLCFAWEAG